MDNGREGDLRVPLVSSLFCILVVAGGVFLVIYVFVPDLSRPWYPIAALGLIGSPWIFWILTYIYTCLKRCCHGARVEDRQVSRRPTQTMSRAATSSKPGVGRTVSKDKATTDNSNDGAKHVHFGEVVVMEAEESQGTNGRTDSSVNSAKEIEMPLNLSE